MAGNGRKTRTQEASFALSDRACDEIAARITAFCASQKIEPTISHGPWGWLCSAYTPVKADDGSIICHVGCDVDMNKVMSERNTYLICISCSAFGVTVLALLFAILFTRTVIVTPLRRLAIGARRFTPSRRRRISCS